MSERHDVAVAEVMRARRGDQHGVAVPVQTVGEPHHRTAWILVAVQHNDGRAISGIVRRHVPTDEVQAVQVTTVACSNAIPRSAGDVFGSRRVARGLVASVCASARVLTRAQPATPVTTRAAEERTHGALCNVSAFFLCTHK